MQATDNENTSASSWCSSFRKAPQQVEIIQYGGAPAAGESSSTTADSGQLELGFIQQVIDTKISARRPVIIKGLDIGCCSTKWTVDYLKSVNPTKLVKVHRSDSPQLDFRKKNFTYQTIEFSQLVDFCSRREKDREALYYLRSLGDDPRGKDISDISIHFPELYKDIRIPPLFPQSAFFSSVFRITSPNLQLWTHYDTCDNILIQIKGRKRIVFFPPWEALNLYLDGDKSQVIDIYNPDPEQYPDFLNIERLEGVLEEGDIVFIPALWFHNITALDFSISVNTFWQNLEKDKYDKKDTYGNHDVIPAQLGFRTLDKAASQLKVLPTEYQDFYLRRMIISLQKKLSNVHCTE